MNNNKFKVNDEVYVSDWMKIYSTFTKWKSDKEMNVFKWKKKDFTNSYNHDVAYQIEYIKEPKLTLKGEPFKDGSTNIVKKIYHYKSYKYEIIETIKHPSSGNDIYLLESINHKYSNTPCYVQISGEGLTTLTLEEQKELANLKDNFNLFLLEKENKNKWSINDNLKEFPKELLKIMYDSDDTVQFGSSYTKGKVMYNYIDKEYTVDNIPLISHTAISYDNKGLSDLDTDKIKIIAFKNLHKIFTNNTFK